jgi:hypothetical protein
VCSTLTDAAVGAALLVLLPILLLLPLLPPPPLLLPLLLRLQSLAQEVARNLRSELDTARAVILKTQVRAALG